MASFNVSILFETPPTVRVRELAERYEFTLGQLTQSVEALEKQVKAHLVAMGFEV